MFFILLTVFLLRLPSLRFFQYTADVPLYKMSAELQPPIREQLFECTAVVLNIINNWEPVESVDLGPLKEGLISLQDTLLGSIHMSSPMLDPFYLLCIYPCKAFKEQISPGCNASDLHNTSVAEYRLRQQQEVLLVLFHALSTYLNIIRWYVKTIIFGGFCLYTTQCSGPV